MAVPSETLVENCHRLLEKFHYSWEMMPLVLVIMNYARSDLDEASRKIYEGYWMMHQWRLQQYSLCYGALELSARKDVAALCCSPRYVLAPEVPPRLVPLQLTTGRHSPRPAPL